MEIVILLAIFALLVFGPRRGGRPRNPALTALGLLILLVTAITFGLGSLWNWLIEGMTRR